MAAPMLRDDPVTIATFPEDTMSLSSQCMEQDRPSREVVKVDGEEAILGELFTVVVVIVRGECWKDRARRLRKRLDWFARLGCWTSV